MTYFINKAFTDGSIHFIKTESLNIPQTKAQPFGYDLRNLGYVTPAAFPLLPSFDFHLSKENWLSSCCIGWNDIRPRTPRPISFCSVSLSPSVCSPVGG